ncbi:aminopeptidase N [Aerosticca soli]|uniref:Aminopeptidase N n=1 Tax=Aerosticca soli TaxID=2010829 RepID=A0A2Z6E1V6_9GAMM|nr:aminopeptidase N [Aerosticca soli]MDI3263176.1 aminopeptidase N [Fulvimonas sp.]BBD78980.1 membrane alanine aminopeptidase N [Aerosticca soli]
MTDRHDTPIRLADYTPPPWRVSTVDLAFDLAIDACEVTAHLALVREDANAPLRLDGEGLELLAIALDGRPLAAGEWRYADDMLEVPGARDGSVLETRVRLRPADNTALEGLYLSGSRERGFLLTQCEAQGFRRITFFPDRPDVLACYSVTLRADRARFPVLLAGGNPAGAGDLDDGRHFARFVDPHPRPSYLFALVAGHLEHRERDYVTADGRPVKLKIWSEADAIDRCGFALDALERAMRWDEQAYGRNYDLDVFHVVATHDFNMGAMENKGLNIFNAKYLLADPAVTTDDEYRAIEAVVGHEYFHNWTGNRVTCRDWFQLSLKEGLTVFREQQFIAALHVPALKRIEDVALLRRTQFPEDAGPLAHPVRPAEYRAIDNFYTATVYEKGAELVRMIAGRLGAAGFRRGMDLYFARHDGRAATIEDFLAALGEANGLDLAPYLAWYAQAGTPRVTARGEYDEVARSYTLQLRQSTPPTPGQPEKRPLPIPLKLALFDREGRLLPLHLDGAASAGATECVVVLDEAEQSFVFRQVETPPVPSLLRDFSAPVILACDYAPADLALLLAHDPDGFNRWEAGQQLARRAWQALRDGRDDDASLAHWCAALRRSFDEASLDPALLAELLTPPGEIELTEGDTAVDPVRVHVLRERLERHLADTLGDRLASRYHELSAVGDDDRLDAPAQARRRLKRRVLALWALRDPAAAFAAAAQQYARAPGMTDRLAALTVLVHREAPQAAAALADFRARHAEDALALDKWFAVQAQQPGDAALARVRALEADPAFTMKNPNRVRALWGSYAHGNPSGFHRADGAGYRFLIERLRALDALNPQVAARLATAFNGWSRLEPGRREIVRELLAGLAAEPRLSSNLAEILARLLAG